MEFLQVSDESLAKAAKVIRSGGLVAFPTETVYGLGADAFNADALVKIFEAKGRPRFDPLIIHIAAIDTLRDVANISLLSEEARRKLFLLTENFWPGPLSIVLPKSEKIPGIATAGLSTAAIRFPANTAAQKLISLSGGAVAAPSANPFGALSPTLARHVKDGLGEKVDIILDGGATQVGLESTVLDITGDNVQLLRYGGVTIEEIEKMIGKIQVAGSREQEAGGFASPGQLKSHYAPRTPLSTFSIEEFSQLEWELSGTQRDEEDAENIAWLFFDELSYNQISLKIRVNSCNSWTLSPKGNISEAAAHLFETLHEMDKLGVRRILAQLAPQEGLGSAINDRLRRAGEL